MDRERARQEIRAQKRCTDYFERSKSGGQYCCPLCGSGHGPHETGALKYYKDTNTWYCFSCGKGGDVIALYREMTGATYNEALVALAGEIGISIDQYRPARESAAPGGARSHEPEAADTETPEGKTGPQGPTESPTEAPPNYMEYYRECRPRLRDPAAVKYLEQRGISIDTAEAYWIGYDPEADPAGSNHPCPRLIIPTSEGHYIGRSIDPETPKAFAKMNPKGSSPAIFNEKALYAQNAQEVFVTEGAFDALSVIEAGSAAISLNSTANAEALLKDLARRRTDTTLILCLDNDEAGQKAAETLRTGLQRLNVSFITAEICGEYKDPNEALCADREAFFDAVDQARRKASTRPDNTADYIEKLLQRDIDRFKSDKRTGFDNLDDEAGGLYAGLYVLAAISSLGKTSFALQLCDQLAEHGNDVIFFSLEQSRLELVSKSLARRTAQKDRNKAVTSLAIRKGLFTQQVQDAIKEYREDVGDRISIVEGNFSCDLPFICDYVRQYIRKTGVRPVVIIDYLQILTPGADAGRRPVREAIDTTVTELKRLSRELDLTIIAISSVNRANYLTPIDFESLKESGGIEFTADVVFGLQLQCLNELIFEKKENIKEKRDRVREAKAENPRRIELVCLKNRYGRASYSCYFEYYPANDLFLETRGEYLRKISKNTPRL